MFLFFLLQKYFAHVTASKRKTTLLSGVVTYNQTLNMQEKNGFVYPDENTYKNHSFCWWRLMNPTEQAFTINITYELEEDCVDCDIIRVS